MKKGFTLIELLAVIVILAVVSLIAVPRIMDAIDESRAGALRQNNEAVIKVAQNYFVDNAIDLPQIVGETAEISLEQLIQNDLINEISSPYSSNNCSGYVLVTKVDGGHEFIPHINCFENITNSDEDNLFLHYTFSDFQEPTTNIVNDNIMIPDESLSGYRWHTKDEDTEMYFDNEITFKGFPSIRVETGGTGWTGGPNTNNISVNPDSYYTATAYIKGDVGERISMYFRDNQNPSFDYRTSIILENTGWNRVEMVMDTKPTTSNARIAFFADNPTTFWFTAVQVEAKPYATPFVNGTRYASVTDYSINSNIGDLNMETSPRWVNNSKFGSGSYLFNSEFETFISKELNESLDYPITMSVWAKRDNNSSMVPISLTETVSRYICLHYNNRYRIEVRSSAWSNFDSGTVTNSNEWVHLTGVFDSDTSRKIYINGNLVAEDTTEAVLPDFNSLFIGKQRDMPIGTGHGPLLFDGQIDDVRIYNRSLSSDEVKQIYNLTK